MEYFVCSTHLTPDEVWARIWSDGWNVNLTSYSFQGQTLTMRKREGLNHQYHMRMIHKKDYPDNYSHIECHYEAAWECTWEHAHEIDLRPLTLKEQNNIIKLLTVR